MRQMYAVYDTKAEGIVGGIILEQKDAPAIRAFHDALRPEHNTVLSEHPSDFQLLCLGSVDDSGTVVPSLDGPAVIATGAQWAAATLSQENNK